MQKMNGMKLCQKSFDALEKGDVRTFDHFTKTGNGAVNTIGKVNSREEMRWPGECGSKENKKMNGLTKSGGVVSDLVSTNKDSMIDAACARGCCSGSGCQY